MVGAVHEMRGGPSEPACRSMSFNNSSPSDNSSQNPCDLILHPAERLLFLTLITNSSPLRRVSLPAVFTACKEAGQTLSQCARVRPHSVFCPVDLKTRGTDVGNETSRLFPVLVHPAHLSSSSPDFGYRKCSGDITSRFFNRTLPRDGTGRHRAARTRGGFACTGCDGASHDDAHPSTSGLRPQAI